MPTNFNARCVLGCCLLLLITLATDSVATGRMGRSRPSGSDFPQGIDRPKPPQTPKPGEQLDEIIKWDDHEGTMALVDFSPDWPPLAIYHHTFPRKCEARVKVQLRLRPGRDLGVDRWIILKVHVRKESEIEGDLSFGWRLGTGQEGILTKNDTGNEAECEVYSGTLPLNLKYAPTGLTNLRVVIDSIVGVDKDGELSDSSKNYIKYKVEKMEFDVVQGKAVSAANIDTVIAK